MISIIVPIYKTEKFLPRCIESILGQTYENLDIILVDNGSPDKAGEMCDEYAKKDKRIRVYHTGETGLSCARNLGLEKAREIGSEYIGFVDSDDWIEPEMYDVLLNAIQENNADIAICSHNRQKKKNRRLSIFNQREALIANLEWRIDNTVWNKLYKTELYNDLEFPVGKTYEDIATTFKLLLKAEKVVVLPEVFYHWEVNPESITQSDTMKNMMDFWNACKSRYDYLSEYNDEETRPHNLKSCAKAISTIWRRTYSIPKDERKKYSQEFHEITQFAKDNYPLFGFPDLPFGLKISVLFAHSDSELSLASAYLLKKLHIRYIHILNKIIK